MGGPGKRSRLSIDEEAKSDSGGENGQSSSPASPTSPTSPSDDHSNGMGDFGSSATYSSAAQRMMVSDGIENVLVWERLGEMSVTEKTTSNIVPRE